MKIDLVNTNNDWTPHPSESAWVNSRPDNTPLPLDDILSLDLPVNEIPVATLFIESTILEREIMTTLRNHVMWAQTSRVQNVLRFTYPEELFDNVQYFEEQRNKMRTEKLVGVRQDEYRRHLPIMSSTKYTLNLSMRDMIHLSKFFGKVAGEIPHLSLLFNSAKGSFEHILSNYFGLKQQNIAKYKERRVLHSFEGPRSGVIGQSLVISTNIPLSLRAQLVRHRALQIHDNLYSLMEKPEIMTSSIKMRLNVQVCGAIEDWTEIVRKRSCWIAQYNLWRDLLDQAEKYLNLGVSGLPCHNGSCPFDGDAKARYTNEDPNAPCPIHADIYGHKMTEDMQMEMINQWGLDGRPSFWKDLIWKVKL